jgi:hypothetical protein
VAKSRKPKSRKNTKKEANTKMPAVGAKSRVALRSIDASLKAITIAAEPPIDHDLAHLDPAFHGKLDAVLSQLSSQGIPFRFVEGFRTRDRQQWLYGSGRPSAVPYGRPGPILTNADGVNKLSKHQGDGTIGSGKAADCYPLRDGSVYIPPNTDPVWTSYAEDVVQQGLVAGQNFPSLKDSPHCEMP